MVEDGILAGHVALILEAPVGVCGDGADEDVAAGLHDAQKFVEGALVVVDEFKGGHGEHGVEGMVGKGQLVEIAELEMELVGIL